MQKRFLVTVEVDDAVETLYPNYRFNYANKSAFIARIADEIARMHLDSEGQASYGYTITVEPS
jgi:hypothetical protein